MRIIDKIKQGRTFSVEIEPPLLGKNIQTIEKILDPLVDLGISFIDITYHREKIVDFAIINGASVPIVQKKKPGTAGVAGFIKARYNSANVEPVPHVICSGFMPHQTEEFLVELSYLGVENVLALRGDVEKTFQNPYGSLSPQHASDLVKQIVALRKGRYVMSQDCCTIDFCIGAACYPEKHKESPDWEHELKFLKTKVDSGVDYLVAQLFFDVSNYKSFVARVRNAGINIPIIPGLFPLSRYDQINKFPELFDCVIPEKLRSIMEKYKDNLDSVRQIGIDWCVQQCEELKTYGVPGFHFYATKNAPVKEVLEKIVK